MYRSAALCVLLGATACGGQSASPSASDTGGTGGVGVGGAGGTPGTGGSPTGVLAWPPEKPSLTLDTLKKEQTLTGPAFGRARLDLREMAGTFEAVLDSKTPCSVAVSAASVTLSGCGPADAVTVDELVLLRAADGALTGKFEAVSTHQGLYQGDMLVTESTKFSGSVELDTTPPQLALQPGAAFPWGGFQVTADEGVDETGLVAAAKLDAVTGSAPAVTWKVQPGSPAWTGASSVVGLFGDWAALADGPSFQLTLGAVPDLNGNSSAAFQATVKTFAIGKPVLAHDFEGGALGLYAGGNAVLVPGGVTGACESGACASIGIGDGCHGAGGELSGLLDVSGKSKVRLRARLVADAATAVPKFQLRLHAPSGEQKTVDVGHFDAAPTSPVLTLDHGASFGDDVVTLPASATIVGFEIFLRAKNDGGFCGMNPGPQVALIVEKIAAE